MPEAFARLKGKQSAICNLESSSTLSFCGWLSGSASRATVSASKAHPFALAQRRRMLFHRFDPSVAKQSFSETNIFSGGKGTDLSRCFIKIFIFTGQFSHLYQSEMLINISSSQMRIQLRSSACKSSIVKPVFVIHDKIHVIINQRFELQVRIPARVALIMAAQTAPASSRACSLLSDGSASPVLLPKLVYNFLKYG